jgi:hypothetical protein
VKRWNKGGWWVAGWMEKQDYNYGDKREREGGELREVLNNFSCPFVF